MDRTAAQPITCPTCSARVRIGDAWCSLCHGTLLPAVDPADDAPASAMPQPDRPAATADAAPADLPAEVAAPAELPAEVAARLEAVLQDETGVPEVPWDRPAVAAAVGAVAVIGVLLVAMTLVGALL